MNRFNKTTFGRALSRRKFLMRSAYASMLASASGKSLAFIDKKPEKWDSRSREIVVIGSGIGGMASGALFANAGHRVRVLEMNPDLLGGQARNKRIGGLQFSMGPQYCWDFNDGDLGDRFLTKLGIKEATPFVPQPLDGFERIFVGDRRDNPQDDIIDFKVPQGLELFRDRLIERFPKERWGITWFFDELKVVFESFLQFLQTNSLTQPPLPLLWSFITYPEFGPIQKFKIARATLSSLEDRFNAYFLSQDVRRILYGHGGIFLENESEISAVAYMLATGDYHRGASFPKHGFYTLFDQLAQVIERNGGSVEKGKKVVRLETVGDKVERVLCDDGSVYPCDAVFSNISPRLTCDLLPGCENHYDYEVSASVPVVSIGLRPGLPNFDDILNGPNFWWVDGKGETDYLNLDVTNPTMLFIASATARGYGRTATSPNLDGLTVYVAGNLEQERALTGDDPAAVAEFKSNLAEKVLDILETNVIPGVKNQVEFVDVTSSGDIFAETGAEGANAYGRRLDVTGLLGGSTIPDDGFANLYNVSATKNLPGIASGIKTAAVLLNQLTGEKV